MNKKFKIFLLYEKNHLKHPFIKLILKSLQAEYPDKKNLHMASFSTKNEVGDVGYSFHSLKGNIPKFKAKKFIARSYGSRFFSITLIFVIWRIFNKFKPSVIITFLPIGFLAAQLWSKISGARVIYYPFEIYGKQHSAFSRFVIFAEILGFILSPQCLVTQNNQRRKFYLNKRFCRSTSLVVHNYKAQLKSNYQVVDFVSDHGIPSSKKVVLYQGMLTAGRWLDRLVESARYFDDDVVLVLMGPKQESWWMDTIEPLLANVDIASRVFVLNSVPHDEVSSYVHASDAGVILYDDEVLNNRYCEPGKIGDFVHAGVPVIAPGFPSITPVVEDNDLGVVFKDYTSKGIAESINMLLAQPEGHYKASLERAAEFMVWDTQWPALRKAIIEG